MRKRALRLGAAVIAAVVVLLAATIQPAGAAYTANTAWPNSRKISKTDGNAYTSGFFVFNRTTLETFMVVPAHAVKACQSCPVGSVTHYYEGSGSNWFNQAQVVLPTNPAYAYYDLALIRLGNVNNVAVTNQGWYYCTSVNCTSYAGGGSAKNCNWCGQSTAIVAANNAQQGWGVIINKMISGTSWGTVAGAYHKQYLGWDFWGLLIEDLSHCGMTHGDSGAPVLTGPNLANSVVLGMLVAHGPYWWDVTNNPCYSGTRTISDSAVAVAWADIVNAYWPTYNLLPIITP